jgi:hypothetical protein
MFLGVPSSHELPPPSPVRKFGSDSLKVFVCRGFGDSCVGLERGREYDRCKGGKTSARLGNSIAKLLYLYTTGHMAYLGYMCGPAHIYEVLK